MTVRRDNERADVFISYSHKDKEWVDGLVSRLSEERIGNRHLRIDLDEAGFVPGHSLVESIERGVSEASKLVCILSPSWVASDWTALEAAIKIQQDPAGRKGMIVPVLHKDCEVPPSLWIRIGADFRKEEYYERAYAKLLLALTGKVPDQYSESTISSASDAPSKDPLIALAIPRDLERTSPDPVDESIALNLFAVESLPKNTYSAESIGPQRGDVLSAIGHDPHIPFIIWENRLWTFEDLESPFGRLSRGTVTGTVEVYDTEHILGDTRMEPVVLSLLNQVLRTVLRGKGIRLDRRRRRYYFLPDYGEPREVPWPGLKSNASRKVARRRRGKKGEYHWLHQAARIRFVVVADVLCLEILPTRCVTTDGYKPMGGSNVGSLVSEATRRVYNRQFWLDVMFWLHQFNRRGIIALPTGGEDIILRGRPQSSNIAHGILGDTKGFLGDTHLDRWIEFADKLEDVDQYESDED